MAQYKFIKKKNLEKLESFESRVNEIAMSGWKVVNFTQDHGGIIVMFEKLKG